MELKSWWWRASTLRCWVPIEPLWNWNQSNASDQKSVKCTNRTFMELKSSNARVSVKAYDSTNRTFMELKSMYGVNKGKCSSSYQSNLYGIEIVQPIDGWIAQPVPIEPLWNWNCHAAIKLRINNLYQSNLYGIEIMLYWAIIALVVEYQSNLYGIEISHRFVRCRLRRWYQSNLYGIEMMYGTLPVTST